MLPPLSGSFELSLMMAIIFLGVTPFVWVRLLEPLERVGWVSGIILVLIDLLTWIVGNIEFQYRVAIGIAAVVVLGITTTWSRISENRKGKPQNERVSSARPERAEREQMGQDQAELVSEPAQPEVVPANLSSANTTKHRDAILANIVETMSNLNLRYSRGEITREEYLKAKSDLQTTALHLAQQR